MTSNRIPLWTLPGTLLAVTAACSGSPARDDAADVNEAVQSDAVEAGAETKDEIPDRHDRPIIEKDGKTLLWANDEEWFDVTGSKIDPYAFQFGIGKDSIMSIDEPVFVYSDDPRLEEAEITMDTPVLGVFLEGEARAYPVHLMSRHEVVNDTFAGTPYAVLW